jgi:transcriptional regulator with XRE-family HTH domain
VRQHELAERFHVSQRQISRWENGELWPSRDTAARMLEVFASVPPEVYARVAEGLGLRKGRQGMEPRAAFDALVLEFAEARDLLPRHLREFAVELLLAADRMGLSPAQAAGFVQRNT